MIDRMADGADTILSLEDEQARTVVVRRLAEEGDIEHFETVRPTLHDIFVRIAKPDPVDVVNDREGGDA